jgi:acetylglutamate kinase
MHSQADQTSPDPRDHSADDLASQASESSTEQRKEALTHGTIVVKIGGSTLGDHDTTLEDLVALQKQGTNPIVVHGGGKVITQWMEMRGVRPRFVRGLRVTDAASMEIVVAVLSGVVNKSLVAGIQALGGRAMGISGADGGMVQATVADEELGLVGAVSGVDTGPIRAVLDAGYMPVIAPLAVDCSESPTKDSLLNVNADTVAGKIAAAFGAERLVFLTDVEGVLDSSRRLIPRLTERQARGLMHSNVVAGGMMPKIEACLAAVSEGSLTQIVDGRKPRVLSEVLSGVLLGTRVG